MGCRTFWCMGTRSWEETQVSIIRRFRIVGGLGDVDSFMSCAVCSGEGTRAPEGKHQPSTLSSDFLLPHQITLPLIIWNGLEQDWGQWMKSVLYRIGAHLYNLGQCLFPSEGGNRVLWTSWSYFDTSKLPSSFSILPPGLKGLHNRQPDPSKFLFFCTLVSSTGFSISGCETWGKWFHFCDLSVRHV